jgi:hypothetical protein
VHRTIAPIAIVVMASALASTAQADVRPSQQSVLILRILAYDRNLKTRAGNSVTIAVLYKQGDAESESANRSVGTAIEEVSKGANIAGLPVRVIHIPFTDQNAFEAKAAAERAAAVYVCPGLTAAIPNISAVTRRRAILSISANEGYLSAGLGIGLLMRQDKATVVVNLPATKAEGADLDAGLLRVAEVIR